MSILFSDLHPISYLTAERCTRVRFANSIAAADLYIFNSWRETSPRPNCSANLLRNRKTNATFVMSREHEGNFSRYSFRLPTLSSLVRLSSLLSWSHSFSLHFPSPFLVLYCNPARLIPTTPLILPLLLLLDFITKRRGQACLQHDLHLLSWCMSNVLRTFRII